MPIFASSDQLYAVAEQLFIQMEQQHPDTIEPLQKSRLVVQLSTAEPAGTILVNARYKPLRTAFGSNSIRPELEIRLKADDLHLILLGKLGLTRALGSGAVKVRGAVHKSAALGDLFHRGQDVYPTILQEMNISY